MSARTSFTSAPALPARGLTRPVALGAAVALSSFALGVALAVAGAEFGPAAVVAGPVVLLGGVAVLSRPIWGMLIVFAALPVGFVTFPFAGYEVKLVQAVAAAVVVLLVLRRLALGSLPLPWPPQMWWGLLFVVAALVATPSAVSTAEAVKQDGLLAVGFLLALAGGAAVRSFADLRRALGVLLVVAAGMCAYGLQGVSSQQAQFGGAVVENRAEGLFAQPNDLGAFAAIVLLVAIGTALGAHTRSGRLGAAAAAVVAFLALAFSLSRGGWLGTAFALTLLVIALPQARRAALAVVLPAIVVTGLVLTVVLPSPPPQVEVVRQRLGSFVALERNPYDDRPAIWAEAVREIRLDPWTGVGPGNFPIASTRSASVARNVGAQHAHDVLLTVSAEAGIPAALLLVGFTVALALLARRLVLELPSRRDRALVAGIAAGMAVQVGQGLVDFNLRNAVIFFLLWALLGLLLAAGRLHAEGPPD
jgi:putative inorganic carbon (HCO3(-)) transporter